MIIIVIVFVTPLLSYSIVHNYINGDVFILITIMN